MRTPVALIIFNRPETTARVFAEVAKARPPKLLVIADGARADRPGEVEKCAATRAIVERVDWDCEVLTNYSEVNLGCKLRPASGLDWVFEQVEEAIILEDDCLPHATFFSYCDELLQKYREDERVMLISGDNFLLGKKEIPHSYYFSRYALTWGWASWRRAWQHFDVDIKLWPQLRETDWLLDLHGDALTASYWSEVFEKVYTGEIAQAWDYQWAFACWANNGLSIIPAVNLVSNIGFGAEATHMTMDTSLVANLPGGAMEFPLRHPPQMVRDWAADRLAFKHMCSWVEKAGTLKRLQRKAATLIAGLRGTQERGSKDRLKR